MNTQLLEALCQDFTAIYQCDLIQDTIDIVRYDKGTHTDTNHGSLYTSFF